MEQADRECLRHNAVKLSDDLVVGDRLLNILYKEKIISIDMLDSIETERTKRDKVRNLLGVLPRRGGRAFRCFVEALVDTDQDDLARSLNREIAEARVAKRDGAVTSALAARPPGVSSPSRPARSPAKPKAMSPQTSLTEPGHQTAILKVEVRSIDEPDAVRLLDELDVYPITKRNRGRAVIINNEEFYVLDERKGSNFDLINLDRLFTNLQFTTIPHRNKTAQEIRGIIDAERKQTAHVEADAFVFVIMSHGEEGVVFGVDAMPILIEEIIAMFDSKNCPSLVGKPKIMFIQACQGDQTTYGVVAQCGDAGLAELSLTETADATPVPDPTPHFFHERLDFIVAYSTVTGYKSWRHVEFGSWFVRAIVEVFAEHCCNCRLHDLLKKVRQKVMVRGTMLEDYKQATVEVDSLTKHFYFMPGYAPSD